MPLNPLAPVFVFNLANLSPAPVQKRDRFSCLPPELLDIIFDEAHSEESPLTGPLSRSLLSFWRSRHFKNVEIDSYKQLALFIDTMSDRTLELVDKFSIALLPFKPEFERDLRTGMLEPSAIEEQADSEEISNSDLKRLFTRLVAVRDLRLSGSTRLARLILSSDVASSSFPLLQILCLRSSFSDVADPYHPAHLLMLPFYTELESLELSVYRGSSTIRESAKPAPPPDYHLTFFSWMEIRGPLSATKSVQSLLQSFVSLDQLTLADSSQTSQLPRLLESVRLPKLVRRLRLGLATTQTTTASSVLPSLRKFTGVEILRIEGGISCLTMPLYEWIQSLPLRLLQLGHSTQLSVDGLLTLVSGATKISTLEHLLLDNIEGRVGRSLEADELTGVVSAPGWIIPRWTDDFSFEDFGRLLNVAAEEKVPIGGETFRALLVYAEFEGQLQDLQLAMTLRQLFPFSNPTRTRSGGGNGRGRGRGRERGRRRGQGAGRGRSRRGGQYAEGFWIEQA